jgi:hypothetical protein
MPQFIEDATLPCVVMICFSQNFRFFFLLLLLPPVDKRNLSHHSSWQIVIGMPKACTHTRTKKSWNIYKSLVIKETTNRPVREAENLTAISEPIV